MISPLLTRRLPAAVLPAFPSLAVTPPPGCRIRIVTFSFQYTNGDGANCFLQLRLRAHGANGELLDGVSLIASAGTDPFVVWRIAPGSATITTGLGGSYIAPVPLLDVLNDSTAYIEAASTGTIGTFDSVTIGYFFVRE